MRFCLRVAHSISLSDILAVVHASLVGIVDSYRKLLEPLDVEQVHAHPDGDVRQWNAAQLIEHLILTYRSSIKQLDERLKKGRPTHAPITYKHRLCQAFVFTTKAIPRRGKAPEELAPGKLNMLELSGKKLVDRFQSELDAMDQRIEQCRQQFGDVPLAMHFILGTLSPSQWRQFHVIHGRHHLPQMRRIVKVNFPI